jgi:hypothetical protein
MSLCVCGVRAMCGVPRGRRLSYKLREPRAVLGCAPLQWPTSAAMPEKPCAPRKTSRAQRSVNRVAAWYTGRPRLIAGGHCTLSGKGVTVAVPAALIAALEGHFEFVRAAGLRVVGKQLHGRGRPSGAIEVGGQAPTFASRDSRLADGDHAPRTVPGRGWVGVRPEGSAELQNAMTSSGIEDRPSARQHCLSFWGQCALQMCCLFSTRTELLIRKLRGLSARANYTDRVPTSADRGCHVVSVADPLRP